MTEDSIVPLGSLRPGDRAWVLSLAADGAEEARLLDLGFTPGSAVECVFGSPMGDPIAYRVRGALVALRRAQSEKIMVTRRVQQPHRGG
ncbi:MAG: hypothetical protein KatS3mg081_1547 [Gemmatimonadales bacterium]|nr:hypothetical protein HRbin33_00763 [bacterium HR33]GIW52192.1 MAG: hypothetical protein KatS3mg081_1547 [Gemmatimonadales bacterium]